MTPVPLGPYFAIGTLLVLLELVPKVIPMKTHDTRAIAAARRNGMMSLEVVMTIGVMVPVAGGAFFSGSRCAPPPIKRSAPWCLAIFVNREP